MSDTVKITDYLEYLNERIVSAQQELEYLMGKQVEYEYKLYHLETTSYAEAEVRKLEREVCRCKYQSMQGITNIKINTNLILPNDFYHWFIKLKK